MENLSLYQLSCAWIDTLESLDCIEDEDERNDAIQLVNTQMTEEIQTKADNITKYQNHLNVQLDIVENEIKRLQDIKKYIQKKQKNMEDRVMYCMDLLGINKIETSHGNISVRNNPLSVDLQEGFDLDKIPQDFVRVKVTKDLDKNAVKDLYKTQGIKLDGIKYMEDKKSLQFK